MSPRDVIVVRGARENNLRNIDLDIPRRKITVFTGVSGSGKSSLVFDTIAAEAQRQLNETFTTFIRNWLPRYGQPDADLVDNLSTAVVIDQKRLGGNSRSTVGTVTDIHPILRLLFSRVGRPAVGHSNAFSFNDPAGMCPECSGIGTAMTLDLDKMLDRSLSLNEGAILHPAFAVDSWYWKVYAFSGLFDNDKKLDRYADAELETLLRGKVGKVELQSPAGPVKADFEGLVDKFSRLYINRDTSELSEATQQTFQRYVAARRCPSCRGTRLNPAALSSKINRYDIAQCAAMDVSTLLDVVRGVVGAVAAPMVAGIATRLEQLMSMGVGYLTLDRVTSTLSGGESQRIKMVRHLSSSLIDMMYIFDEPSIGLHPHDVHRMNELLRKLRDKGNTVLVVEHDRDVIAVADHIVDLGPAAGTDGGQVVYHGSLDGLATAGTRTGEYLGRPPRLKTTVRTPPGHLTVADASMHNLRNVTVRIPQGVLTVVTGVAGSGKSTLVNDVFLAQHPEAIAVDQSALRASSRSNPATYTGMLDPIRKLFARANGVKPGMFSFNSAGACPNCSGLGILYTDLAFLDPIKAVCDECGGRRFTEEVLRYTLHGASIADVLAMTAGSALRLFEAPEVVRRLQAMVDVGLGYLTLGQPLSTLSGGECQRIKLATQLHRRGSVYVLDEPTTGLHSSDVDHLLELIDRLVDDGNTVIVIEHNLDVVAHADWIIDLGPEGGSRGGEVVFEGTPAQLLDARHSLTGTYLRRAIEAFDR